tara:strand:- start:3508 stop:3864 length:357 start_codon:yes stop_codon:yes gene_type:complete
MITTEGKTKLKDYVISTFTHFQVGTGGDSTNPNAGDLDSPLGSKATISSASGQVLSSGESSIDFSFTILGSAYVGNTIKEVGIFDSTGNTLLVRVNYDGIGPLTSSDEVEFIITVEVD